jgi:aryl-alcohol dehydrogenase-like predicted oxidoreductase
MALGTVQWGLPYGIANRSGLPGEPEVARMLARAREAHVTTLDTARAYGSSEAIIGRLIGADAAWTVVTKTDPAAPDAAAALEGVERSRAALQRPVLDVVLLHRAHQRTAESGRLWDVLRRERECRRVGRLGVSAGCADEAWQALDDPDVDCLQVACSLLDPQLQRAAFFQRAKELGRTVFVRSVYLQGVAHLRPEELPPHLRRLRGPLEEIGRWARDWGVSPSEAFLAYGASLPGAWIVIGCDNLPQLEQNLASWSTAGALAKTVVSLAESMPVLPAEVTSPALWPVSSRPSGGA